MDERTELTPHPYAPQPSLGGTNGKAIASLVLGIVGLTGLPLVASVLALVFGYMARSEITASGQEGKGLATAGIILGWVGIVVVAAFMAFILVVLVVNFSAASSSGTLEVIREAAG